MCLTKGGYLSVLRLRQSTTAEQNNAINPTVWLFVRNPRAGGVDPNPYGGLASTICQGLTQRARTKSSDALKERLLRCSKPLSRCDPPYQLALVSRVPGTRNAVPASKNEELFFVKTFDVVRRFPFGFAFPWFLPPRNVCIMLHMHCRMANTTEVTTPRHPLILQVFAHGTDHGREYV